MNDAPLVGRYGGDTVRPARKYGELPPRWYTAKPGDRAVCSGCGKTVELVAYARLGGGWLYRWETTTTGNDVCDTPAAGHEQTEPGGNPTLRHVPNYHSIRLDRKDAAA